MQHEERIANRPSRAPRAEVSPRPQVWGALLLTPAEKQRPARARRARTRCAHVGPARRSGRAPPGPRVRGRARCGGVTAPRRQHHPRHGHASFPGQLPGVCPVRPDPDWPCPLQRQPNVLCSNLLREGGLPCPTGRNVPSETRRAAAGRGGSGVGGSWQGPPPPHSRPAPGPRLLLQARGEPPRAGRGPPSNGSKSPRQPLRTKAGCDPRSSGWSHETQGHGETRWGPDKRFSREKQTNEQTGLLHPRGLCAVPDPRPPGGWPPSLTAARGPPSHWRHVYFQV